MPKGVKILLSIYLILFSVCQSCLGLGTIKIGLVLFVQISFILIILKYKRWLCPKNTSFKIVNLYLAWVIFCFVRGIIIADNYWEYRQLTTGFISLLLPTLLWLFYKPSIASYLLSFWYKWAWIPYLIFFAKELGPTQYYLQPLLVLFCFFSFFRKREGMIIITIALVYALWNPEEERAPFIKTAVYLLGGLLLYYRNHLSNNIIKIGHFLGYASFVFLFIFIFTDSYRVIIKGESIVNVLENNKDRDLSHKDTRSLLYIDVINSAVNNNYIVWGRTPARGFDIKYSGVLFLDLYDDMSSFNKNERHKNEMLHSNIFTWTGLIGFVLYSLIYMIGSYLAVYKSNNKIIPIIGCLIAWRWSWGWVEDVNIFLATDIDLWLFIAMCYSHLFRNMNDMEFISWIKSLLNNKKDIYVK